MTQAAALPVEPEWGHRLAIWDTGRVIRVPQFIFPLLKERGFLARNKPILLPTIKPALKDHNLDPIMLGLRQILGEDLTGPNTVECPCRRCHEKYSDIDHTRLPGRSVLDSDRAAEVVRDVKGKRNHKQR